MGRAYIETFSMIMVCVIISLIFDISLALMIGATIVFQNSASYYRLDERLDKLEKESAGELDA